MALRPDDDPVLRLADIAVEMIVKSLPSIRAEIITAMRNEFAGENVYMPKALGEQKAAREVEILADHEDGLSLRAIGRKHSLSKTRVASIIKGDE